MENYDEKLRRQLTEKYKHRFKEAQFVSPLSDISRLETPPPPVWEKSAPTNRPLEPKVTYDLGAEPTEPAVIYPLTSKETQKALVKARAEVVAATLTRVVRSTAETAETNSPPTSTHQSTTFEPVPSTSEPQTHELPGAGLHLKVAESRGRSYSSESGNSHKLICDSDLDEEIEQIERELREAHRRKSNMNSNNTILDDQGQGGASDGDGGGKEQAPPPPPQQQQLSNDPTNEPNTQSQEKESDSKSNIGEHERASTQQQYQLAGQTMPSVDNSKMNELQPIKEEKMELDPQQPEDHSGPQVNMAENINEISTSPNEERVKLEPGKQQQQQQQQQDAALEHQQEPMDSEPSPSPGSEDSAKTNDDLDDNIKDQESPNNNGASSGGGGGGVKRGSEGDDNTNNTLGRNRRVRQKNRYFADFHCMQLVKGTRSKDDYDVYSPATSSTRSSNRRSTTDSRGQRGSGSHISTTTKDMTNLMSQDDDPTAELFVTKHCRKCSDKTPHDDNNECQACLYKKIVSSSKRQKTSNSKARTSTRQQASNNNNNSSSTKANNLEGLSLDPVIKPQPVILSDNATTLPAVDTEVPTIKQHENLPYVEPIQKLIIKNGDNILNSKTKIDTTITTTTTTSTVVNKNKHNNVGEPPKTSDIRAVPMNESTINSTNSANNAANIDNNKIDSSHNGLEIAKLDQWTPDQVANYVSSKGFVQESDLFRIQAVDGITLLLMKRTDFTHGLKMKLGPALKLYDQVCKLKGDYFRGITVAQ